jgi:hypothetical protein
MDSGLMQNAQLTKTIKWTSFALCTLQNGQLFFEKVSVSFCLRVTLVHSIGVVIVLIRTCVRLNSLARLFFSRFFFFFFFLLSSFFLLQHGTRSVWRRQTGEMTTVVETTHRVDSVANVNDRASSDSDERKQAAASPGGRRRPVEAEEENAALVMASFEEE